MNEPEWRACTTCGEMKPVFMWLHPDTENLPYCHQCGPHRLELEAFPTPLEDVPVEGVEDEGGAK